MPDIVIPEAVFDEFLRSLHSKIAAEMQEFRARLAAKEAVLRAQMEVAAERKLREVEDQIERRARAFEARQLAHEQEIERLRQIELSAAAVREDKDRLQ
jgi:Skp family chaperone for outer membrane proteins